MISTAVIAPTGAASIGTAGILDTLIKADRSWKLQAGDDWKPLFDVALVGLNDQPVCCKDGVFLQPQHTTATLRPDLVIVPALDDEDHEASFAGNREWVPWIKHWHDAGARVASSCTGAFLVADTGLLDGRRATTHWLFANLFHEWFPLVTLATDQLIVDDGDIISSGGATAFLTLVLYLIERYGGYQRAAFAAKVMLVDANRTSQLPFVAFNSDRNHDDTLIRDIQDHVDVNLGNNLDASDMASKFGLSPRTLTRRFRSATNRTYQSYIRHARIQRAKFLLETTIEPIGIIQQLVGYQDPTAFRRAFHDEVQISPTEYRARYGARQAKTNP
jgi:transcriptional regulator GlxA family with amidase domain